MESNIIVGDFIDTSIPKLKEALEDVINEYVKEKHLTYAMIIGILEILKLDYYLESTV